MPRTVAHAVLEVAIAAGVRRAYTVPGESFLGLLDAAETDARIRLVSTRHESGAGFMAEAEAKLTGTPALAMASRGPGAANLAIAVHTALQDQTPMVVVLGQVASDELGREAFQEVDLAAFFAPVSKWSVQARHSDDVPELMREALRRATGGRPGPVVLSVPADFWDVEASPLGQRPADEQPASEQVRLGETAIERAGALVGDLLAAAERPVAIAGPGLRIGRAELAAVAAQYDIGVYTAFRRQDSIDAHDPHYLGHLGLGVPAALTRALDEADLVLVLGTRLDAVTSQDFAYPRPDQHLVMVGPGLPRPDHAGVTTVLDLDTRAVLAAAARHDVAAPPRDWRPAHAAAIDATHLNDTDAAAAGLHPGEVVSTLRRLAPEDAVVTNDAGNFSAFLHRYWTFTTSHRQLGPCNGAMGYAVPAAVAAKLTHPDRTVIAAVGDGGLLMTGHEIETAVRHDTPLVVLVFRNGSYGTIAMHQAITHQRLAGVDIGDIDPVSWARGLGAHAHTIHHPSDIEPVLKTALATPTPFVVDVPTDPDLISPERHMSRLINPDHA